MTAQSSQTGDEPRRVNIIRDGLAAHLPDIDPDETAEWLESFDAALEQGGQARARYLMLTLLQRARERHVGVPALTSTDYVNTIPTDREPWFPGDEDAERAYRRWIRWNAAMTVHRAQRPGIGVGGHISSYASSASLYEVGFNHFFRGKEHAGGGDQIYIQGHASPGIYARAYLEGRLSEDRLDGFRQELSHGGKGAGLPSYPHPRLMPDFWEFPTVSMGLGPMNAIMQARFNRYLGDRGIKDTSRPARLGVPRRRRDGRAGVPRHDPRRGHRGPGQPDVRDQLQPAAPGRPGARQREDHPGAGGVLPRRGLERDQGDLGPRVGLAAARRPRRRTDQPDEPDARTATTRPTRPTTARYVRDHFFGRDPRTKSLVEPMSDAEIWNLKRGGHDYRKVHAAYAAAMAHHGQPTVILAKTIKGYGLGSHFAGRNATHQMKKLSLDDLKQFRDEQRIPISDAQLEKDPYLPPYYHPGEDAPEIRYMQGAAPRARRPGAVAADDVHAAGAARRQGLRDDPQGLGQAGGRHDDGVRPAAP